jgi:hypothetical protein
LKTNGDTILPNPTRVKGVTYNVTLEVEFTAHDLGRLAYWAGRHYDWYCESQIKQGGFIYGWMNKLAFLQDEELTNRVTVMADFKQLDTCAKILEISDTKEDAALRWELGLMLKEINRLYAKANNIEDIQWWEKVIDK